jgi:MHS family proline/betaine transporter-like MFS transporter
MAAVTTTAAHRLPTGRPLAAGSIGNLVEWYDFSIFGASATLLATVLTPGGWSGLVGVFAVLAVALLLRPLGAVAVGRAADRIGRRRPLATTILLMTVATGAIGLLPPWGVVGLLAPIVLWALRGVQAFASGGEVSTSVTYLAEYAPASRRGWWGGWHLATIMLGAAAGTAAVTAVHALVPSPALEIWGWRLPFLAAVPVGVVGLYLRFRLADTPAFRATAAALPPPAAVWRHHRPAVLRGFAGVAALSCAFNVWFVFLPSLIVATGRVAASSAFGCALIGLLAGALAAPLAGRLSDGVGRRPVLLGASAVLTLVAAPAYAGATSGHVPALLAADVAVGVTLAGFVLSSAVPESFPLRVRATGVGLAYGVASAVVGGSAPLVAALLQPFGPAAVPAYVAAWSSMAFLVVLAVSPGDEPAAAALDVPSTTRPG